MNLIIDIGNTSVKLAVFKDNKIIAKEVIKNENFQEHINLLVSKYPSIKHAVLSSVGKLKPKEIKELKNTFDVLILNTKTKLPFKNLYQTPKTLGVDRIALVCASIEQFHNKNVLIIDAGTCITYDFVSSQNYYFGGSISPGIKMRYKALNKFTARLPLLDIEIPNHITGDSTHQSIHSGVVNGVVKEIDGIIAAYKKKYPDLTVILTGGDTNFLSKQLKSSIFAHSNFLLKGLNYILQYNLEK